MQQPTSILSTIFLNIFRHPPCGGQPRRRFHPINTGVCSIAASAESGRRRSKKSCRPAAPSREPAHVHTAPRVNNADEIGTDCRASTTANIDSRTACEASTSLHRCDDCSALSDIFVLGDYPLGEVFLQATQALGGRKERCHSTVLSRQSRGASQNPALRGPFTTLQFIERRHGLDRTAKSIFVLVIVVTRHSGGGMSDNRRDNRQRNARVGGE